MKRDLLESAEYREAHAIYQDLRQPGAGLICDIAEVSIHGSQAVFTGTIEDKRDGNPATRICAIDLGAGDVRVLTSGPHTDRWPKFSPDGRQVAFLSDRGKPGDFQLHLLDPVAGNIRPAPVVAGWIEYLHWSPDGSRIVLGVAGHGADVAGGQGAVSSQKAAEEVPSWLPVVESGDENFRWRCVWIYEPSTHRMTRVDVADTNVWEVVWCGNDALAAVASSAPGEGHWYRASLQLIELTTAGKRELYLPKDQLGWLSSSPSGSHIAVVEAICSDRGVVAGDLKLISTATGSVRTIDTKGIDVTYTEWRSEDRLLIAGHRGFETVVARVDIRDETFKEVWASSKLTLGGAARYPTAAGLGDDGDCVLVCEGFLQAPEIGLVEKGRYRLVRSFDLNYAAYAQAIDTVEQVVWKAPDGLDIQGWLLLPKGVKPHPLVMCIHGGPISMWRSAWLGRPRGLPILMLVRRGYAVFLPNPRGSAGRGQDFARLVVGDMGGADTYDYLSGIDDLVARGIADPHRLGVTGISYGGFMSSWLVTQDARFAAAAPVAPVTHWVTEHLLSNIPHFVTLCLADTFDHSGSKYFTRSPIMHAAKVKTPSLIICGALDRCTPPQEAMQFHNALLENGVRSLLVTYPEEGHGIRKFPASIDYAARVVAWFEEHLHAH